MSEEEENSSESVDSTNQAAETKEKASSAVSNIIAKAMELKESNPKVFFGALGGVVLLILIMMMSGGESPSKHIPVTTMTNLSIGQTYSLKSVNTYDPEATVRLVAVPGSMAAYDDTEEADRSGDCKHMPQGTKVKLIQIQDTAGARFAQVEMINGDCAGRKAWAISNNLN